MTLKIAGAGLAGLLAAHAWPQAEVFEAESEPRAHHKALLRFRSATVSQLTGIEFQQVTVRKGIWLNGEFVEPNISIANKYSAKILGSIESERSVWSLEPVQRYIAPENFYEQLIEAVGKRIHWGTPISFQGHGEPLITTVPLPIVLNDLAEQLDAGDPAPIDFKRAPIRVLRFRVPQCSVYQTVYFPAPAQYQPVYRASITGDLLIVECAQALKADTLHINDVMEAFGIFNLVPIDEVEQKYGKIVPLPAGASKALLFRLTTKHNLYSLGRFATWRNVLLDDVVNDIGVIRRLLRSSQYDQRIHFS